MNPRKIISIGAVFGFLSVLLGAFGAHALQGKIGYDLLEIYKTATHYLTIHAIALVLYGLWAKNSKQLWPAYAFIVGILIFSGTLYAITFTAIRMFGAVTPIGGLLLMAGWIGFAVQSFKSQNE